MTRIPSLELSCEDGRTVGVCDSGYTYVYSNNISWRSPTTPSTPEVNPRAVFERLFGTGEDAATRAKLRQYNRSILDGVLADSRRLAGNLGPSDRRKLDAGFVGKLSKTPDGDGSLLDRMGAPVESLGDSSGQLAELS